MALRFRWRVSMTVAFEPDDLIVFRQRVAESRADQDLLPVTRTTGLAGE